MPSSEHGKIPRIADIVAIVFFVAIAALVALVAFIVIDPLNRPDHAELDPNASHQPMASEILSPEPTPDFGPISFGIRRDSGEVMSAEPIFPSGTSEIYASWSYENMRNGTPYRLSWFRDDASWRDEPYVWDADRHGSHGTAYHTPIGEYDDNGLEPGNYRLELFIGDRQARVATFIITTPPPPEATPEPTPQPDIQTAGRAALLSLVQVAVPYDDDWYVGGSGSIVDGELGLILTNWHVLTDEDTGELLNEGLAAILTMTDPDAPPVFSYWAQVIPQYSDPEQDLAILRIEMDAEHRAPVQPPLSLPSIPWGDSEQVRLGDHVLLLGYPDYAVESPSWTEGIVATRYDEWILSDAQASHGHSGGMMLNEQGELIGILTGYAETSVGGGFVRARPFNKAIPLIELALGTR